MDYKKHLIRAYEIAQFSQDPSTQNGAILIDNDENLISTGANNFCYGVKETPERWERPVKYKFVEHAERNAIYHAARDGEKTEGLTMVCGWAACCDCARAIVAAGITKLVRHKKATDKSPEFWLKDIEVADQILKEGGDFIFLYLK